MCMGALILLLLFGCGKQEETKIANAQASLVQSIFSKSVSQFNVKVFYESTAVPYTGALGLGGSDTWDISQRSYEALFSRHPRKVSVPHLTSDMSRISAQNKANWTQADLIALGNSVAPPLLNGNAATVSVIFLSGLFNGNNSIIGVHFSGSSFAFVFKDVVTATGGNMISQRYVEQATVVHELGHVVGLVNNGLPMAVNHEDTSHPHHSTDSTCVMYWQVENPSDILAFVTNAIGSNRLNLFGQSQSDAQSFHP